MNKIFISFLDLKNNLKNKRKNIKQPKSKAIDFENLSYFQNKLMFVNLEFITRVYIHCLKDYDEYRDFENYINWEKNQIFFFISKKIETEFFYIQKYFSCDLIISDLNFNILQIHKAVKNNNKITLPYTNKLIFIVHKNFCNYYNLKLGNKLSFYKLKI